MRPRSQTSTTHRWALAVAVAGSALIVAPSGGVDGITVSKATVVVLAALAALALAAWAAVREAELRLPRHPAVLAAGVFALVFLVRALLAAQPLTGLAGAFGRWNGAVFYLACAVLFVVAAARGRGHTVAVVIRTLLVTAVVVGLLAVDEVTLQLGPDWADRPAAASTLGNPNFLAAWCTIVIPLAVLVAADWRESPPWRWTAVAAIVLGLAGAVLSESIQGGVVLAGSLAVLGLVWLRDHTSPGRWRLAAGLVALAAVVLGGLTLLGARQAGPLAPIGAQAGVEHRAFYWTAAGSMIADQPLTGVGPGRFSDHYRTHRPVQDALESPLTDTTDSVHNVTLQMFAEGGLIVGLAYLVWLVLVAMALVRGVARHEGRERLLVGAVGAAWVGYVLQATVSIDTPALAVLGWVLGGLVVGLAAAPEPATAALPWRATRRNRAVPMGAWIGHTAVALVVLAAVWAVSLPLRADAASDGGEIEVGPRDGATGQRTATTRATELAGWLPDYWLQLASVLVDRDEVELAATAAEQVLATAPRDFEAVVNAARLNVSAGDEARARELFEHARSLEPHHPDLAVQAARFAVDAGEQDWARELLDEVLALDPDHEQARELRARL